ncbi:unnamed protein product, partial [Vitis vinifera]
MRAVNYGLLLLINTNQVEFLFHEENHVWIRSFLWF